jgi:hypothetical protein
MKNAAFGMTWLFSGGVGFWGFAGAEAEFRSGRDILRTPVFLSSVGWRRFRWNAFDPVLWH